MSDRQKSGEYYIDALANLLEPFVVKLNFIEYGAEMDNTPVNPLAILPHKRMVSALFGTVQECGEIKADDLREALLKVHEMKTQDRLHSYSSEGFESRRMNKCICLYTSCSFS